MKESFPKLSLIVKAFLDIQSNWQNLSYILQTVYHLQQQTYFCSYVLRWISSHFNSDLANNNSTWIMVAVRFCIRIHNVILYLCYCPKPITFSAENEELCVKALLSKIYWKYLSLYGIYKSKEWWQMKFLKTEIHSATICIFLKHNEGKKKVAPLLFKKLGSNGHSHNEKIWHKGFCNILNLKKKSFQTFEISI